MVLGWLRGKGAKPSKEPVVRKVDRKTASDEWVKHGEDLANSNRPEEAIQAFDKAIEILPQNAYAWGDKALMLDKLGRTDEALIAFARSTEIDSSSAITWNNKGLTLLKAGKFAQAVESFDKAIECNGKYAKAWYNKGRALTMLNKVSDAQRCFDVARKMDPLLFAKLKKMH
ncbi:MAG: tetratricopeptide repeat protein [Nitrososphaera sp.]|jgi:tetratricopeptide (TPR) repeat protein